LTLLFGLFVIRPMPLLGGPLPTGTLNKAHFWIDPISHNHYFIAVQASESKAPAPEPPKVPRELLTARRDAARQTYTATEIRIKGAQGTPLELAEWSRRWLEGDLALSEKETDRVRAYQAHWERMKKGEDLAHAYWKAGQGRHSDAVAMTYHRLEAEIWYFQADGKLPKGAKLPPGNKAPALPERPSSP